MPSNKPKLRPLQVPWEISSSDPNLDIGIKSFDGIYHGYVTFMAFLGSDTTLSARLGTHKQVAITLECVVASKLYPNSSEEDNARINAYDWELIPDLVNEESLDEYVQAFHEQWRTTGYCPDPSAYVIDESDLLQRYGLSPELFKHYLFIGDNYWIEIIAKKITWQFVGELPADLPVYPDQF